MLADLDLLLIAAFFTADLCYPSGPRTPGGWSPMPRSSRFASPRPLLGGASDRRFLALAAAGSALVSRLRRQPDCFKRGHGLGEISRR
jgi:hypothetical protein